LAATAGSRQSRVGCGWKMFRPSCDPGLVPAGATVTTAFEGTSSYVPNLVTLAGQDFRAGLQPHEGHLLCPRGLKDTGPLCDISHQALGGTTCPGTTAQSGTSRKPACGRRGAKKANDQLIKRQGVLADTWTQGEVRQVRLRRRIHESLARQCAWPPSRPRASSRISLSSQRTPRALARSAQRF